MFDLLYTTISECWLDNQIHWNIPVVLTLYHFHYKLYMCYVSKTSIKLFEIIVKILIDFVFLNVNI